MGLFNKKKEDKKINFSELPSLPDLPDLPPLSDEESDYKIHQLPSFPTNSLGQKFSQSVIKDAVAGEKEVEEDEADDYESQMRLEPSRKPLTREIPSFPSRIPRIREISREAPREFRESEIKIRRVEPVYIRIDKFEESLKIFEETKEKIMEMERLLAEIKSTKEKEEQELDSWEKELLSIKEQIEKANKDIFSKIE